MASDTLAMTSTRHSLQAREGHCAMRGSCGKKTFFGLELPCPNDDLASEDNIDRDLLVSLCGPEYAEGPTCCAKTQIENLGENLARAEGLVSACPACRNNFREFWCTFTCSPNQATFLNVTSTQETTSGETAVQSVDFHVSKEFGEGFYNSCKSVQMGATNAYAMDLIGGGAKNYSNFFKFMGDEKDMGSPFQIDFPLLPPSEMTPLARQARNCYDDDLGSRCTCIDCPDICPSLPPVAAPGTEPTCHVGLFSCLTFVLVLVYSLALASFLAGYITQLTLRKRRERSYERVALSTDGASESHMSPRIHTRGLVGASSLAQHYDGAESTGTQSETRNLGRGASLLDPIDTVQPRQYRLNTALRRVFYKLGLICATSPWLTFAVVFAVVGLLNLGWKWFSVETDPVRLWVSPDSESKLQKDYFDEHFGPFYRPEQIFVTSLVPSAGTTDAEPHILSWNSLKYWMDVEETIRGLQSSPHGYTLEDVCFKPQGPDGYCVVQSVGAWFGNDLGDWDSETWQDQLLHCATSPGSVECLPDFQQPLGPEYVLGGIPREADGSMRILDSKALVINIVVSDSLDKDIQARALEWETTLKDYLLQLSAKIGYEAGLSISWSTGVSLEEEINKSTNMDIKIVVLSYIAMFFYVALTLGNGSTVGNEEEGIVSSLSRWARNFPKHFKSGGLLSSDLSIDSRSNPTWFPRLPRKLFVGSKFALGLFGIALVILSVSSSVGLFSMMGVKVTLIIAEVIPFLVLAVGVDNVFILVHELDRQNLLHGPNASAAPNFGFTTPMSPTRSRSQFDPSQSNEDSVDAASMPLYLSPEERVARTLAKMGPSILLSSVTEVVAFALGALVPMPAVRNFALYAAGSVLLNAVLQVTVLVSALVLDLRRIEASRVDCFPCVRLPSRIALLDPPPSGSGLGTIAKFIRRHYAPFLLKPQVKAGVLFFFTGLLAANIISIQHIKLGLGEF
ncbi:hypothetical protein EUX98_g8015 [Antrodiella citrinella]|uniref:SSD domain-containing protein n=1 Tax=Antrodiella citrinella TaxID=2447956 RepID=A0A4V3XGY4_9APHY|nr:hypothetical protein EUX98_g8015 [Antrodiella citrinella]